MNLIFTYGDRRGAFAVNLGTSAVRLGGWSLMSSAEQGQPDTSTIEIDDPSGNVGHSGDQILGLKTFVVTEASAGTNNARIFTGYTADREYASPDDTSLITGAAVRISLDVVDLNQEATFHVITGSDGNRPAETIGDRVAWVLASTYVALEDNGLVIYPDTLMDANDYRNQTVSDVFDDCAQAAQYNWFIYFDEAANAPSLFFDDPNASTAYSSSLRLSNVLADIDSTVNGGVGATQTWAPLHPKLRRSPSLTASGAVLPYASSTLYKTRAATADTYGFVDRIMADANVKTLTAATYRANQYLWQFSTEQDTITCSVQLPPAHVNDIREGQRLQVKFRQLPGYKSSFTWCRVLHRSVGQADLTNQFYTVDLTLSPQEEPEPVGLIVQSAFAYGYADGPVLTFPNPVTPGNLLVVCENRWKGNGTNPVPPNASAGAGNTIGGTGAWNLTTAIVTTAASGDRSHVGVWTKTATASDQTGPVFSAFTWAAIYEIANVTATGAVIASQTNGSSSGVLDAGSLGTPAAGGIGIMVAAQYSGDVGPMSFLASPWTTDTATTGVYFSTPRPYWQGHFVCDGSALEAEITSSVTAPWCAIGMVFPAI